MGNDMVGKIVDAFEKFNPELYVIAIWNMRDVYLVVAKHTPNKNDIEMDPFYIYSGGKIDGITYTDNKKIFDKLMKPDNLIYERR